MMPPRKMVYVVLAVVLFAGCLVEDLMAENTPSFHSIQDVPALAWEALAAKSVYFGHQSVGDNILAGVRDLMQDNAQITLNIRQTVPSELTSGRSIFAHSAIGKNGDPHSKIESFFRLLEAKSAAEVEVAFFKFCYVDFDRTTDVNRLFDTYKATMLRLQQLHPRTTFVHVTVPLVSMDMGFIELVKMLLGRSIKDAYANVKRNQFNELLRKEFTDNAFIFDLAGVESTFPDGRRASFTKDGKTYASMVPNYTDDGGHLNETGRRIVAEQFLVFLAALLK
jgi:hypothetical protein